MLSKPAVRSVLDKFVCIKVDPRGREMASARAYKATRFVPEVVLVSSNGKVLSRLESRDVEGAVDELEKALDKSKRWANR